MHAIRLCTPQRRRAARARGNAGGRYSFFSFLRVKTAGNDPRARQLAHFVDAASAFRLMARSSILSRSSITAFSQRRNENNCTQVAVSRARLVRRALPCARAAFAEGSGAVRAEKNPFRKRFGPGRCQGGPGRTEVRLFPVENREAPRTLRQPPRCRWRRCTA